MDVYCSGPLVSNPSEPAIHPRQYGSSPVPLPLLEDFAIQMNCHSQTNLACVRRPHARVASRRRKGFTLLELLLVLSILVVIGGIAIMNLGGAQEDAYRDSTTTQLNSVKQAIERYRIKLGSLPETIEALKDGPSDAAKKAKWTRPILDAIPNDAWGNPLVYSLNSGKYEIRSAGPDGQVNTDDDITAEGS